MSRIQNLQAHPREELFRYWKIMLVHVVALLSLDEQGPSVPFTFPRFIRKPAKIVERMFNNIHGYTKLQGSAAVGGNKVCEQKGTDGGILSKQGNISVHERAAHTGARTGSTS